MYDKKNAHEGRESSLPSGDNESMQYGSPRTTTSCMMIPNE